MNLIILAYIMKGNHTELKPSPLIEISAHVILIDGKSYTSSILIESDWEISEVEILRLEDWIEHPKRRAVPLILSYPNIHPDPKILDIFWAQHIPVEILSLQPALELIKLFIAEQRDYQAIIMTSLTV